MSMTSPIDPSPALQVDDQGRAGGDELVSERQDRGSVDRPVIIATPYYAARMVLDGPSVPGWIITQRERQMQPTLPAGAPEPVGTDIDDQVRMPAVDGCPGRRVERPAPPGGLDSRDQVTAVWGEFFSCAAAPRGIIVTVHISRCVARTAVWTRFLRPGPASLPGSRRLLASLPAAPIHPIKIARAMEQQSPSARDDRASLLQTISSPIE